MNVHEYQAKALLARYSVSVPRGQALFDGKEAAKIAETLGGPVWVVKSQIHAGGRGAGYFSDDPKRERGGGVRVVTSGKVSDVQTEANDMLGKVLITKQTGPSGKEVKRLYIEEGVDIKRELYLALLVDRTTSRVSLIASTEGGMEIEEVAARSPEKIFTLTIDPLTGLRHFHALQVADTFGLREKAQVKSITQFLSALYKAFTELDAQMIEINPLVVTGAGNMIALDAKMSFDANALYHHPDIAQLRDEDEEDASELEAAQWDLNYVKLDGEIGCMVNGAGLAMATMDIIKFYGAEPANFLDVGGSATKERVTAAFKIILSDPNVKGIFINIFGGIMRCDIIAEGVIAAARDVSLRVPLVVRLEGTNVELGKKLMADSGLPIIAGDSLADGAEKITRAVKEAA